MTNYWLKGGCYFFTMALAERRGRLLTEHIQTLRATFREFKTAQPFTKESGGEKVSGTVSPVPRLGRGEILLSAPPS